MIYTLTLNPALDHVVGLDRLELGETNRMTYEEIQAGGKGINVSKLLHHLGEESLALGFIGGFTGRELERKLREEERLQCDFIHLERGSTRINTKIKAEQETEINGEGLDPTPEEIEKLMQKMEPIGEGDYLFLSGSIPKSLGSGFYAKIMEELKDRGIHFIVDTTGHALRQSLDFQPLLIKPNRRELEGFFNVPIQTNADIKRYAKELQTKGAQHVIVSLGGDGAYFLSKEGEELFLEAPKGRLVDSVGSGDSMLGGFVYGMVHNFSAVDAFKMAVACGSATAFSHGIGQREDIESIYRKL